MENEKNIFERWAEKTSEERKETFKNSIIAAYNNGAYKKGEYAGKSLGEILKASGFEIETQKVETTQTAKTQSASVLATQIKKVVN